MSKRRVGVCSICGGDVYAYQGAWLSIDPPPPPTCSLCGAQDRGPVIEMTPPTHSYRTYPTNRT